MLVSITTKASIEINERQALVEKSMLEKKLIFPEVQSILDMLPEDQKTRILSTIIEATLKKGKDESMGEQLLSFFMRTFRNCISASCSGLCCSVWDFFLSIG